MCVAALGVEDELQKRALLLHLASSGVGEEHDQRLDLVMKKLEENGRTLNYQKCQICVTSVEYLTNIVSEQGLQVFSGKVEAIMQASRPKDQSVGQLAWHITAKGLSQA